MLFSPEIFTTFMSLSSSNIPMVTKSKALALTSLNAVASSDVRYSTPIPSGFTRPDFRFLVGGCPISSLGYPSMSSLIRARNSSVPLVYFVIEYPRKEASWSALKSPLQKRFLLQYTQTHLYSEQQLITMVPSTNTILENKVFKNGNFLLDERRIQPHISFYGFPVSSSISFIDFIVLANSAQPNYDCFITP